MFVVRAEGLTRFFGARRAVGGITFEVDRGCVFGLLGPNGAGKTTTLNMMVGLLKPSAGTVSVLGLDPVASGELVRARVGVVMEDTGVYDWLSVYDNLEFYARLNRLDSRSRGQRIRRLLEVHGLWNVRDQRARSLSRGMRQRLAIARAMVHEPCLLLLDEPSAGLDPEAQAELRLLILDLSRNQGVTVFLNTHNLDEARRVCDRVSILVAGRIVRSGTPEELEAAAGRPALRIRARASGNAVADVVSRVEGVASVTWDDDGVTVGLDTPSRAPAVNAALVAAGIEVLEMARKQASLEEAYLDYVREARADEGRRR